MPCMCGDPTCWSCGPAQGFHVHTPGCVGENNTYKCGEKEYGEEETEIEEMEIEEDENNVRP